MDPVREVTITRTEYETRDRELADARAKCLQLERELERAYDCVMWLQNHARELINRLASQCESVERRAS